MTDHEALGAPIPERSGETIDEAVATAEAGSQVEGVHTPSGQAESGESRLEQMPEVKGTDGPRVDGEPSGSGDSAPPVQDGVSGAAQRVVGARTSDRIAAGEDAADRHP
jgi:hypothetical protein